MTQYSINLNDKGQGGVTVIEDDEVRTWTSDDPNFNHVLAAVHRGKNLDEVVLYRIPAEIIQLSSRVTVEDNVLHFDGRPVEGEISDTVLRYRDEGRSVENIVLFMERLADNVTPRSRNELFKWLTEQELQIDEEGFVIGYRGLTSDRFSQHAGGAYVQRRDTEGIWGGNWAPRVWIDGHVPNMLDTRVSLDRDQVDDNSDVGCSHGLHVGSERYARSWADSDTTIVVRVDPADVVSVPNGEYSKMRVCAYEIIGDLGERDFEPEASDQATPEVEDTDATLDEIIPGEFRSKMSRTERFRSRFLRRRNAELSNN